MSNMHHHSTLPAPGHIALFDETGLSRERVRLLYVIIIAVAGCTIWTNITNGSIYAAFIKDLNISDTVYGMILSAQQVMQVLQLYAARTMEKHRNRNTLFMVTGIVQRSIWIPIGLLPLLVPASRETLRNTAIIGMILLASSMAAFINVTWYSVMEDVVPIHIRGHFLSVRNSISTAIGIAIGLFAGKVVDWIPGYYGYFVVFLIAGIFGTADICSYFFFKLPPMRRAEKNRLSLKDSLRQLWKDPPFLAYICLTSAVMFAYGMFRPYQAVYLHNELGMSMFNITLYDTTVTNICIVVGGLFWGNRIDRQGAMRVTCHVQILFALSMVLWLYLSPGSYGLLAAAACMTALLYNAPLTVTRYAIVLGWRRDTLGPTYYSMYSIFTAVLGTALGSQTGGWLLDHVCCYADRWDTAFLGVRWNRYTALFALSMLLTLLFSVIFAIVMPRIMHTLHKTSQPE